MRQVRGALGDPRQAIECLAEVGGWIDGADLDREQTRLVLLAGDTATAVQPLAERLEAGLEAFRAAREGG